MASSCHYLATVAAFRVLEMGGNAADAGVAGGLVINVVQPHLTSLGGVAPILWASHDGHLTNLDGVGVWPARTSIAYFQEHHGADLPGGILRTVVPAAIDSWLCALDRFGSLPFYLVAGPAIELAQEGFPVSPRLARAIERRAEALAAWPGSAEAFLPDGRPPVVGQLLCQPRLSQTLQALCEAELKADGDRAAGLQAARDRFYRGDLAESMASFSRAQGGLLEAEDLAGFAVREEPPVVVEYGGWRLATCGPWSQGPVLPQALRILEGYDLAAHGHQSADYLHLLAEALDLAFADREAYYGDPSFVDVPMDRLLSAEYAEERRALMYRESAFAGMPPPGKIDGRTPAALRGNGPGAGRQGDDLDTSYICVVDSDGNAFSATPSDPSFEAPLVPELGFMMSTRGRQSWLDPGHPSALAPGKRPRLTPNPAVLLDASGKPIMPFGCPGGDGQTQAMLQVLLNILHFGMNVQQAIEAPRIISQNFPSSFWPHTSFPNRLNVEGRIAPEVTESLRRRGHDVAVWPDFAQSACGVCAVSRDPASGVLTGGADPRHEGYAIGW